MYLGPGILPPNSARRVSAKNERSKGRIRIGGRKNDGEAFAPEIVLMTLRSIGIVYGIHVIDTQERNSIMLRKQM